MQKKNIYLTAIVILFVIILAGVYIMMHIIKPNTATNNPSKTTTSQTANSKDTIQLETHKSLEILTDSKGITLYHDMQDWPRNSKPPYNPYTKCTGTCSDTWPPFYTDSIKISAPLKASDFTVFTRPDGKQQISFRGWPLYYYTGDSKPGDANGQNIANLWFIGVAPE